jgi:hypothetical protein
MDEELPIETSAAEVQWAPPPPKRSWVRRVLLLEDRIAASCQRQFEPGQPGHAQFDIALRASRCGEALFAQRTALSAEDATPAALSLFREALWWALTADALHRGQVAPSTPAEAWDAAVSQRETGLATLSTETLMLARRTFVERSFLASASLEFEENRKELIALRVATDRVIAGLNEAAVSLRYLRAVRIVRLATTIVCIVALLVAGGVKVQSYRRGPNLALHRPILTSSILPGTADPSEAVDGVTSVQGFHTQEEYQPWIRIDLGKATSVREVVAYNCAEFRSRAIPLVVELSTDGERWTEVGRREKVFSTWSAAFKPALARYVRLRVAGRTYLHLNEIEVYGGRRQ